MRQITIPAGQRTLVVTAIAIIVAAAGALMPQPMQNFTSTWMALDTIEPTVAFTLAAPSFEP